MSMRISTRGFKEAVERLRQLGEAPQAQAFRDTLVDALEPMASQARANVNSITGRTVSAIVVSPGKNPEFPSAYLKVDRRIASMPWRGKPFAYPYAVEYGHGGPRPAPAHPFFAPAYVGTRAQTRQIVRDGIEQLLRPYITTMSVGGEFS